jgi:hypothetical protein
MLDVAFIDRNEGGRGRMLNKRWIVELATKEQWTMVPAAELELATCINCEDGRRLLVYRDKFNAYKAATLAGAKVCCGEVVPADAPAGDNARPLDDDRFLVLGVPADAIPNA